MSSPGEPSSPQAASPVAAQPSSPQVAPPSSPPAPAASPPTVTGAAQEESQTQSAPAHILPAEYWAQQELFDDGDSAHGDDAASSTDSLTSSVLAYRTLHGRTYNSDRIAENQNWTPNDEGSMEASDIAHHMLTLALDGELYRAPLEEDKLQKALDVGTGTGIWAMDFADKFPNTTVIGTDISPSQPPWVPPNLHFELDDATKNWAFERNEFDYIHMRYLLGSIADWPGLLRQAFRCCKPGGYVESYESSCNFKSDDGTVVEGSALDQWGKVFVEAGKKFGRPFDVADTGLVRDAMEKAGFVDIVEWTFKMPLSPWPQDPKRKEIGAYAREALWCDIEGWILFVWTQIMGWRKEEITVYAAHVRQQLRDLSVHPYFTLSVVYGRKPDEPTA